MKRLAITLGIGLLIGLTGWAALHLVPLPVALRPGPAGGIRFTDRNGTPLRESLLEGSRFVRQTALADLPPQLLGATVAAEDKRFWSHHGVDPLAIARASLGVLRRRRVVSGASTISQQLIKMAEPRPRTLPNKLREAAEALRLEERWTKQQILEAYLNRVDYGNFRTGIASAADYYFAKPAADLSLAESAFLAGLPQAPSRLNPYRHFARALTRQRWVLARMEADGLIAEADGARAKSEPIHLAPRREIFDAPHFVDLVRQRRRLPASGEVRTTLDLPLTSFASQALRRRIGQLRDEHVRNGALVVIENRTGNVLALVGSEDYRAPAAGQVNGAWSARSAGSTFKPFTYLLALEHGFTAASVLADVPVDFSTPTGVYRPENYNHLCSGPVRLRLALANSLNIPAVKTLAAIGGAAPLQRLLRQCGLTTLNLPAAHYGLGLTIGNANARLLELTNGYAALARLGEFAPFRLLPNESATERRRVGSADACYLLADILNDNAARTLAFGSDSWLRFDFPVAVKTGTSTSYRDNWAIGYTPEFTAGVWVGNFDGSPMHDVSGVSGAAPVLHDIFEQLHREFGTSWYARPATIRERPVQPLTGKLATAPRAGLVAEKFLDGNLPPPEAPNDYNASGRVKLGAEYDAWLASAQNELSHQVAPGVARTAPLCVLSPLPGSTYFLDPDLPESDRLPLESNARDGVVWESATLPCAVESGEAFARLRAGRHEIVLRDPATGARAKTWIVVKAL